MRCCQGLHTCRKETDPVRCCLGLHTCRKETDPVRCCQGLHTCRKETDPVRCCQGLQTCRRETGPVRCCEDLESCRRETVPVRCARISRPVGRRRTLCRRRTRALLALSPDLQEGDGPCALKPESSDLKDVAWSTCVDDLTSLEPNQAGP